MKKFSTALLLALSAGFGGMAIPRSRPCVVNSCQPRISSVVARGDTLEFRAVPATSMVLVSAWGLNQTRSNRTDLSRPDRLFDRVNGRLRLGNRQASPVVKLSPQTRVQGMAAMRSTLFRPMPFFCRSAADR